VLKRRGRTLFRFRDGIVFRVKPQAPQAVLMIERERDLYRATEIEKKLSSRILEPVRRAPF
jgi:hypothetical protein